MIDIELDGLCSIAIYGRVMRDQQAILELPYHQRAGAIGNIKPKDCGCGSNRGGTNQELQSEGMAFGGFELQKFPTEDYSRSFKPQALAIRKPGDPVSRRGIERPECRSQD